MYACWLCLVSSLYISLPCKFCASTRVHVCPLFNDELFQLSLMALPRTFHDNRLLKPLQIICFNRNKITWFKRQVDKHEEDDLKNKWKKQPENMTWSNITWKKHKWRKMTWRTNREAWHMKNKWRNIWRNKGMGHAHITQIEEN